MVLSTPLKSFANVSFQVFPNPLLGQVYIDCNQNMPKACYEILNKDGDLIKKCKSLSTRNTISLDSFPVGIYTIIVKGGAKSVVKSFLKL